MRGRLSKLKVKLHIGFELRVNYGESGELQLPLDIFCEATVRALSLKKIIWKKSGYFTA